MKIIVTGAGGFVGSAFVANAMAAGHEVIAILRPDSDKRRLTRLDVETVSAKLSDQSELEKIMLRFQTDVIVHTAWSGVSNANRHQPSQINENMTIALVKAAISARVNKFIGIGSQAEYGLLSGKISESAPPAPTSLYGEAKVAVQEMASQQFAGSDIDFAWLRLFSTYGPHDNSHWLIPSMIEELLNGSPPRTTEGRQLWDYLFIDDVADAIRAVVENKQAVGVFNLGSGVPVPVRSIIEQIRDMTRPDLKLVFGDIPYKPDQIWHMEANIERLTRLTGFTPKVGLQEGLSRTVAWHKSLRGRS